MLVGAHPHRAQRVRKGGHVPGCEGQGAGLPQHLFCLADQKRPGCQVAIRVAVFDHQPRQAKGVWPKRVDSHSVLRSRLVFGNREQTGQPAGRDFGETGGPPQPAREHVGDQAGLGPHHLLNVSQLAGGSAGLVGAEIKIVDRDLLVMFALAIGPEREHAVGHGVGVSHQVVGPRRGPPG